jgi:hypothetical protein
MAYTVFVSHSGQDFDLVRAIQDAATPLGVTIYTFEQDLQPGNCLPQKLLDRIRSCDAMIVLLTQAGCVSPAVNQEIGAAKLANKLIMPIIDDGIDPKSFPMLQGVEYLTLNRVNPAETLLKLTTRLAQLKNASDWGLLIFLAIAAVVFLASRSKSSRSK